MPVSSISFILGAVLIFVAMLGGGIEIKELKVPKFSKPLQIFVLLVGLVFLLLGFLVDIGVITKDSIKGNQLSEHSKISYTITSVLGRANGAAEIETNARVHVDGKLVAEFLLNKIHTSKGVTAEVPSAGKYLYTIEGCSQWTITKGRCVPIQGAGEIEIRRGGSFEIWAENHPTEDIQIWPVTLRSLIPSETR